MTSGWDEFSTRRLWPLATLSTVQNMGGMQKKDVVFWSEQHVFVSPSKHILFFMLFFQGLVVLNGIRYAFLRPTRFPLQIPKCRAPLKQHEASALPTIHRCQVVHPLAWQIQRYPANKSQIFSYVVYTIPSHCHQVSPMFIQYHHPLLSSRIMNYHQFSSTYCFMIKWSPMMVPASPYKSNHQSAIHRAAQSHAEICQRHAICILTSLRLGIHPGTAPENMLPLDPERTRETRLWSW